MQIFNSKHRLAWLAVALSCTVLVMIPLITGAAPNLAPPNGTTTPTFSGLNINDNAITNLKVNSSGEISNPAGSNPVYVKDANGLKVTGGGQYSVDISTNGRIRTGDSNNTGGIWLGNPSDQFVGQYNSTTLGFWNNGNWRVVIDKDGKISNPLTGASSVPGRPGPNYPLQIDDELEVTGGINAPNLNAVKVETSYLVKSENLQAPDIYAGQYNSDILTLHGEVKAPQGIGTYKYILASKEVAGNGGKEYFTLTCPSNYQMLSCGYKFDWFEHDLRYMIPEATDCLYRIRNNNASNGTLTGYGVCFNAGE